MKKYFAAALAMTVGLSAFGAPEVAPTFPEKIVYDYKASFKRIDAQYKIKSFKGAKAVTDQYTVKSDTIYGYVLLPTCTKCTDKEDAEEKEGMEFFNKDVKNSGYAYLTRRGDKYSKKANLPFVVKTNVTAQAGIFGAYVKLSGSETGFAPQKSEKDIKRAWMSLDYRLPGEADFEKLDGEYVLPKKGLDQIFLKYNFFGIDNEDAADVFSTGFGSAKALSFKEGGDFGWCGSVDPKNFSCQIITSISGSMIGHPTYMGACDVTPMWDVCYSADTRNNGAINEAVVAGTWTLKYNKKLTESATKDADILKKLKVTKPEEVKDITDEARLMPLAEKDAELAKRAELIAAHDAEVAELNGQINGLNDQITELNGKITALEADKAELEGKLTAAEAARDQAIADKVAAEAARDQAVADKVAAENKLASETQQHEAQIKALQDEITSLNASLEAARGARDSNAARIERLKAQVEALGEDPVL